MARSDCLLSSSLYEAFSTVVCEALLLEVPVITTACSGMEEIFGETLSGIIVDNSEEGLYQGVKTVLSDVDLLTRMKGEARNRSHFFSPQKVVSEIESTLDSVMNEN